MAVVLVTGVSGLGRDKMFHVLQDRLEVCDLGDKMGEVAQNIGVHFDRSNVLRLPSSTLAALRMAAIEGISSRGTLPLAVSAHAVFMLTDRVVEGLNFADVRQIHPDMLITLIDAPQLIHERLKEHSGEYFHLTVESIVKWQEFEVFVSHHMARELRIRHFVVPVNQPETFLSIVSGDDRPVAYVSYPMTHLPKDAKPKVSRFVEQLKKNCVVFDPSSIESSHANKPYYRQVDYEAIHNHTIVRDLDWFIGINAQMVVGYWPEPVFSSGMNDELRFAYESGRETYLVVEAIDQGQLPTLSPFTTYKSKVFGSSEDFFGYLALSSEALRDAFFIIQAQMFTAIRMAARTGKKSTIVEFRESCLDSLKNSLPDNWIKDNEPAVNSMADSFFERWQGVLDKTCTAYSVEQPDRIAPGS